MVELIRRAEGADLDLLCSLITEFHAESDYALDRALAREAMRQIVEDASLGRLWIILDAGEPAGYIAVTFGFSLEFFGRDAFIDDLFIRPGSRGRGLGNRVLELVEAECRELGVLGLHLEVERSNRRGQALYRKRGFRDTERQLLSKRLLETAES